MNKVLTIALALMLSFTTVYAGDDHHTFELARDTEPESGGGDNNQHKYMFLSRCGLRHILETDHELNADEKAYWQGYFDNLCPENVYYL